MDGYFWVRGYDGWVGWVRWTGARVDFGGEDGGWMDGLEYVKREDGGGWFGRVLKADFVVCVRWRIRAVIC